MEDVMLGGNLVNSGASRRSMVKSASETSFCSPSFPDLVPYLAYIITSLSDLCISVFTPRRMKSKPKHILRAKGYLIYLQREYKKLKYGLAGGEKDLDEQIQQLHEKQLLRLVLGNGHGLQANIPQNRPVINQACDLLCQ
ncbi:hypothetical protein MKW98_004575 [Papaver atlanticum]|uniref:Uncharacterized protein n=1 Tax=Papaver atlanticum TaxID=357466 RepID=A0AAD4SQ34_9MAGN|nr:hypothetical protein MKW98_004575 [Papaver atlanticum]